MTRTKMCFFLMLLCLTLFCACNSKTDGLEQKVSEDVTVTEMAAESGDIIISDGGTYTIQGKHDNCSIIIDAKSDDKIMVILDDAQITSQSGPCIYVKSAKEVTVLLPDGTSSDLTDTSVYDTENEEENEPSAVIFSRDDLVITGSGRLMVCANYNNGIQSKDKLHISDCEINVTSVDDAFVAKDMITFIDASIIAEAGGDGIKCTNDTDSSYGNIIIDGGEYVIRAGADAIQSANSITVKNGEFDIFTGGTGSDVEYRTEMMPGSRGGMDKTIKTDTGSYKGIKASADIFIEGGSFVIDSRDDSIHSNDTITISGGSFEISSGDDGIHADTSIYITGGDVYISRSYEGIESADINISDGAVRIYAWDDGINISGGTDSSALGGRPGQNSFNTSSNDKLSIDGGYIMISSNGDGIDANGSIYMNSGTVIIHGTTANNNGALDYDGVFELNGGILVASGSAGMPQAPSAASTQAFIGLKLTTVQPAGQLFNISDSKGKVIATFIPDKQYQIIIVSSPEIETGENYTLSTGGESTGILSDGLYSGGVYKDGQILYEFTLR